MSGDYRNTIRGVTLIEILIALVILAVLVMLIIPLSFSARQKAAQLECAAKLRTVGMALRLYSSDHDGYLPYAEQGATGNRIPQPYWNSPWTLFNGLVGPNGEAGYLPHTPIKAGNHMWSDALHCPADPNREFWGMTSYGGISLSYMYRQSDIASGGNGGGRPIRLGQPRNPNEVHPRWLVVDRWGSPGGSTNLPYPGASQAVNRGRHPSAALDNSSVRSYWHEGGANVLYEDGSVLWRSFPEESMGLW